MACRGPGTGALIAWHPLAPIDAALVGSLDRVPATTRQPRRIGVVAGPVRVLRPVRGLLIHSGAHVILGKLQQKLKMARYLEKVNPKGSLIFYKEVITLGETELSDSAEVKAARERMKALGGKFP
jgi:hypothetical protein